MPTTTLPYSNATTSKAAAIRSVPKSHQDCLDILITVANAGAKGLCDEEIQIACPQIHKDALRARRGRNESLLLITKCAGQLNLTSSGNSAKAWHITASGLNVLGRPPDHFHIADQVARDFMAREGK